VSIDFAVVTAALILFFVDPSGSGFFPPCPFHMLTGLYCPGCGSLRATHQLLHGNFLRATAYNPAIVPALITVGAVCVSKRVRVSPFTPKSLFVAIIVYALLRNLPMWPFALLAPH
jgi:hypothetical protein